MAGMDGTRASCASSTNCAATCWTGPVPATPTASAGAWPAPKTNVAVVAVMYVFPSEGSTTLWGGKSIGLGMLTCCVQPASDRPFRVRARVGTLASGIPNETVIEATRSGYSGLSPPRGTVITCGRPSGGSAPSSTWKAAPVRSRMVSRHDDRTELGGQRAGCASPRPGRA